VVSTATQLGYALGLFLLVPLGDSIERRRLIVVITAIIVVALLFVAFSPTLISLIVSSFFLGAVTIVPQIVVPFAAHLAPAEDRGRVIGIVMSGLLIGVILSRSVSGFAAAWVGWRATYIVAAVGMAILAVILRFALPIEPPEVEIRYRDLLRSLASIAKSEPVLRRHAIIGACGFGAFSIFWTSLAFHLARLSPSYGTQTVGAFGLIGVAGALVAPIAGRVADRYGPRIMNGSALALMVIAFVLMAVSGASLVMLAIGVILLDAGAQGSQVTNQSQIFGLDPALRNRLNAVYMVAFFIGGAIGSTIAGLAWQHGGWTAVCTAGATFALAGLIVLFATTRSRSLQM
jgi:predicted MFS family arabinose efflux permease